MKNIISLSLIILLFNSAFSQTTFTYQRTWGTYVGGTGNLLFDEYKVGTNVFHDSQNNIYTNSTAYLVSGYQNSYYDQYVLGGNNCDLSVSPNLYHSVYSANAPMIWGGYKGIDSGTIHNFEILRGIDHNNNKYILKAYSGIINNLSTSGVWLTQNQNLPSNITVTLSKYTPSGILLWTTYLPNTTSARGVILRFDEDSNIYLVSDTKADIPGLTTPGVFVENFIDYQTANMQLSNSYIVKLNSSGQKLWATYSPLIIDYELYDGSMYAVTDYEQNMPGTYTDAGTFQPLASAQNLIIKINANTGQKDWGTFYGTPFSSGLYSGAGIYGIEVSSTGVYVSGENMDQSNPTYFATSGAFKPQLTGDSDLFLSKFGFTGNRLWSTYFSTNGYDTSLAFSNLSVFDNKILITGNQYGATDNISTPLAFLNTIPNTSTNWSNMYFAEFDASGARKWCSYYGGPGTSFWGEYITPRFLNDGSFILYGTTGSPTGIGTENGAFPYMLNPAVQQSFGYIGKFDLKNPLSTSEVLSQTDIQLYDNPNDGNFYIKGDILQKQKASIKISDWSGRLIATQNLEKEKINFIQMKGKLSVGNYLLEVFSEKAEQMKVFKITVK
jgi:hypothetical protein